MHSKGQRVKLGWRNLRHLLNVRTSSEGSFHVVATVLVWSMTGLPANRRESCVPSLHCIAGFQAPVTGVTDACFHRLYVGENVTPATEACCMATAAETTRVLNSSLAQKIMTAEEAAG